MHSEELFEILFIVPLIPVLRLLDDWYSYDPSESQIIITIAGINILIWAFYALLLIEFGYLGLLAVILIFISLYSLGCYCS